MAENQNIPIDQHYVPRSYLRNFSKIIGTGKKEKNHVCFFQFLGEFYRENVPTKSICYKYYFYGEDGILEKSLSVQESQWSKVLKKCCQMQCYDLDQNDESDIKEFAIYQMATKGMIAYPSTIQKTLEYIYKILKISTIK